MDMWVSVSCFARGHNAIIEVYLSVLDVPVTFVITPFGVVLLVYLRARGEGDKPQHQDKRCDKMFIRWSAYFPGAFPVHGPCIYWSVHFHAS